MMRADTAIAMSNLIPNGATVDVRKAVRGWTNVGSATTLRGIFNYDCPDGNSYLIGYGTYPVGSNTYTILYNLTSATTFPVTSAIIKQELWSAGIDFGSPAPVSTQFGGFLFIASGIGSSSNNGIIKISKPTGSGGAFQASDVTTVLNAATPTVYTNSTIGVYKNRIYIGLGPSYTNGATVQRIVYSNVNQVSSTIDHATNIYDYSYLCQRGGETIFAGSVTRQEGQLSQALFAIITSEGEVLVFQGDYPGSITWALMGYYVIPKPLGKRAFFYIGSSLYIITQSGIFSFADLTSNYGISSEIAFSSDYINNKFPEYAGYALSLDSLTKGVTNWYGTYFPKENKVFVGYPESPSTYGMLVQDLTTKGWGQLNYPMQIAGTAVHKDNLYGFAPASYTMCLQAADTSDEYYTGSSWVGSALNFSAKLAPNYNGDFSTTKQFTEVKALVECLSPFRITCGLTTDFDLRNAGTSNMWGAGGDGYGMYQPRFNTGDRENVGKCCIINIGGSVTDLHLPMKFVAFEVYYTEGGNW